VAEEAEYGELECVGPKTEDVPRLLLQSVVSKEMLGETEDRDGVVE
jgi:hypothetical protein